MADARIIDGHLKSGKSRETGGSPARSPRTNERDQPQSIRQEPLEQSMVGSNRSPRGTTYRKFADWLNRGDTPPLVSLPGMVSSAVALSVPTPRKQALETMERQRLPVLPVVDENQRLVGVVERGRLVASLILDVSERIN